MADSTAIDFSKMKVTELRKELKSRGLPHTGDKNELVGRLQAATVQEVEPEITLDSDEIDSDGVLEDEDEKTHDSILDESAVSLSEDLVLADPPPIVEQVTLAKPQRTLKRKATSTSESEKTSKATLSDCKNSDNKDSSSRKIVLNRATSITTQQPHTDTNGAKLPSQTSTESNKVKINANFDTKTRLEMRAKRFGLPVKMSESERKQARQIRFGQNASATGNTPSAQSGELEKFKKRAERFGQSVSKVMTDLENRERLEKRKAKFGAEK